MKRLINCLAVLFLLAFLSSCQKEVSVEQAAPAKGSLQSSLGDCLPKSVSGVYTVNRLLIDSNFLEVTVDVLSAGAYTINTDTVNGYYFKASGVFSTTGATKVKLAGTGKPLAAGVNDFQVIFDTTYCFISIVVSPAGTVNGPATFAFKTPGTCASNFATSGAFVKDVTLDATNKVDVTVNVTAIGTYSISTATVNGYSFAASSMFSSLGQQTVTLQGTGKPLAAGTDNFTTTVGGVTCGFPVTVSATAPSPCGIIPQGTYTAGTVLTASNKIVLTHTYATAGNVSVSTNSVNGYSFGPVSVAATAGSNTITLTGVGTPVAAGTNSFTVNFGDGTSCTFTVIVAGAVVGNADHFPLTANSFWTYDDPSSPGDSIKYTNKSTATFGGNAYRLFEITDDFGPFDTAYYRKSGNDYFEYTYVDAYSPFTFDNNLKGDINFLRENLNTADSWNSAEYTGPVTIGTNPTVTLKIRYVYTCADNNATVVVNGKTFNNCYKINFKGQYLIPPATTYTDDGVSWVAYYAKGIGLVQITGTDGTNTYQLKIRNWMVF